MALVECRTKKASLSPEFQVKKYVATNARCSGLNGCSTDSGVDVGAIVVVVTIGSSVVVVAAVVLVDVSDSTTSGVPDPITTNTPKAAMVTANAQAATSQLPLRETRTGSVARVFS